MRPLRNSPSLSARLFAAATGAVFFLCATAVDAAVYTWDPSVSAGIQSGGGTWNNTGANAVWTVDSGVSNIGWSGGNSAAFSGDDSGGVITVVSGLSVTGGLDFLNSGYTLQSASAVSISMGNMRVASGKTATLGANLTNTSASVGTAGVAGGKLILDGGRLSNSGTINILGNGTEVEVKTGGSLTPNGTLVLGNAINDNATLTINGGSLTTGGTGNLSLINTQSVTGASATVTLNSGTITLGGTSGRLMMGTATSATVSTTFNLNGGTLSVAAVTDANAAVGTFNFNGGILKTSASNVVLTGAGDFMSGVNNVNVKAGGAKIDTSNGVTANNITISSALAHEAGLGATTDGGLEKLGLGTLTLTGANTYTGETMVTTGGLATGATGTFGNGNINIGAGASLTLGNGTSIADTATLLFTSTSSVGLSFVGTETVGGIQLQSGGAIGDGTYSADDLNNFFGGTVFSGAGFLQVSAIPEPSTWAMLLGSVALTGTVGWRRRR